MYQIFPDRFSRGNPRNLENGLASHRKMGRVCVVHERWDELPLYRPIEEEGEYFPCDFFGGDLAGIAKELPRLNRLGITAVYCNPICEAASNHRYDTADYKTVDPILGTNEDFAALCREAETAGIRILVDGVYSHTGADSRYFNKEGCYPEPGAYQGETSPYYPWYTFRKDRDDYQCWWGFKSLPEVNEQDQSWQEYVITGEDSVLKHWMNLGASGFRLDVADELPDEIIEKMRTAVKEKSPDRFLLGEVWEDATTKCSYGCRRRYALGSGLDSVMNYPFRDAVIGFFLRRIDGFQLADFLTGQQLNYPRPMYYALMNLLSSHDVPRIRTVLSTGGVDGEGMTREEQAVFTVRPEDDRKGAQLQRLAAVLQFTVPGIPCIYYGDEYGMQGLKDPFNRKPFEKRDPDMALFYEKISALRRQETALTGGYASFLAVTEDVIAILRFTVNGEDAFGVPVWNEMLLTCVSRCKLPLTAKIDLSAFRAGVPEEIWESIRALNFGCITDLDSGEESLLEQGQLSLELEAESYRILRIQERKLC